MSIPVEIKILLCYTQVKRSITMLKKLTKILAQQLQNILQKYIQNRPPDFVVGEDYLKRWWLIPRNPFFNVYYHYFRVSDDDRKFHDHSYINMSFLLHGEYVEHMNTGKFQRSAGDIKIRLPKTLHRIEIPKNGECWTIFITGPRVRDWGFQVGNIKRNWLGFKTNSGWMDHETYFKTYGIQQ